MTTQHFDILIHAPPKKVWATMLQSPTYERWTTAFCEGSRFEGSWDEGQKIRFVGPDGLGMEAEIAAHRPAEFVSIRHLRMINPGVEDTTSEAASAGTPCFENYTFTDEAGGTRLHVDCDEFGDCADWMAQTWPKALAQLKILCEGELHAIHDHRQVLPRLRG